MDFSSKNICSISEANQDFSRAARMAEEAEFIPDEDLLIVSDQLMRENQKVYEALAK
ncbi:hypothetical protein FACS1894200_09890 [Spirochaetia bacterium]|nr:hypothetical protein FACS1894200_09890 [Spirochaetia bacterium]